MKSFAPLTDSHTHLRSIEARGLDLPSVIENFHQQGGNWLLDVGLTFDDWPNRRTLANLDPKLRFSCGVHPSEAQNPQIPDWGVLESNLSDPLVVAVGEIGLDWYRGKDFAERQREFLGVQLDLAMSKNLPVILHVRSAMDDVLTVLRPLAGKIRGVFHCFSGDELDAKQALDLGFFVSFAGNLSYKGSEKLQQASRMIPVERLLVETDAPYLAPLSYRGTVNEPALAGETLQFLASLRGQDPQELRWATTRNFEELFGLS